MKKISKSAREYRTLKEIRSGRSLNDHPLTSTPRYGTKTTLSTRRTEKRTEKWAQYV